MKNIKNAEQLNEMLDKRRDFRFESGLARYMRQTMHENKKTLSSVAIATGLSLSQVSDYRSDYKVLTQSHAEALAKYFSGLAGEEMPASMFTHWQSIGYIVYLKEGRQIGEGFLSDSEAVTA